MGLAGRIAAAKYFLTIPGGAGGADGADTTFNGSDEGRKQNPGNSLSLLSIVVIPFPPVRAPHSGSVLFPLKSPNLPLIPCVCSAQASAFPSVSANPETIFRQRGRPLLPRALPSSCLQYPLRVLVLGLVNRAYSRVLFPCWGKPSLESRHAYCTCTRIGAVLCSYRRFFWALDLGTATLAVKSFFVFCFTACYLNEFRIEIIIYLWVICKFPSPCLHGLMVQVSPLSPVVIILMTHCELNCIMCRLGLMRCQILS